MSLSLRIFIGYCIFILLCGYFIVHILSEEIRPAVRQSTEETLVDTANLLAEILREPLSNIDNIQRDSIKQQWTDLLKAYGERRLSADIWGINKTRANHRIYVTNAQGIVIIDSQEKAEGQDYSEWRDVYLSLRGQYGARSSEETVDGEITSVMYVAAPIVKSGVIKGVVSVSKPNSTVAPYISRAQWRLGFMGGAIVVIGLVAGGLFSWWLGRELSNLRQHALKLSRGEKNHFTPNLLGSRELRQLGQALDTMRRELDGKDYIESYVQSLTHEIKSPIAAIQASCELLAQHHQMPRAQQENFIANITQQAERMLLVVERLLTLARLEAQAVQFHPQLIEWPSFWQNILSDYAVLLARHQLTLVSDIVPNCQITADPFLLRQALNNLLDNAIAFAPAGSQLEFNLRLYSELNNRDVDIPFYEMSLYNPGPSIPDYALPRLIERFYSLPRPNTGQKSTGLGLNAVAEICRRHGAVLTITNHRQGVLATLSHWPSRLHGNHT